MPTFLALFVLALAGFFLFALCSSLLYWYETLNTPDERIPSPKPGPVVCVRQYLASLAGYFLCVGVLPFGLFLRRWVEKGGDAQPVICIHGLNNNAAVWLWLSRRMDREGYSVSTYSYFSLFVSLERVIAGLDAHIRKVEAAFPGKKPLLVCHSLGGLLARHWLDIGDNRERLSGLVTLGTPHRGSKLAALAPGRLAANIVPGSAFLAALSAARPLPFPCTALVSPTDEAVLPASGLLPPEGWTMRVTARAGHFGMLFRPSICAMVLEELKMAAARRDEPS